MAHPFDAKAVKWSIDRVIRLKGDPSWLVTDFVDRVEVLDKYKVKFVLKNPVCIIFHLWSQPCPTYPVNPNVSIRRTSSSQDPTELKGGKLVGLGPYQVAFFKTRPGGCPGGQSLIMYGDKSKNDMIIIRYFADATTMRLALEKGELDFAFKSFNPSDISDLQKMRQN